MYINIKHHEPIGVVNVPLEISVHRSLREVEHTWRAFEAEANLTPYQRFDWMAAALMQQPAEIAIVVFRRAGKAVSILPLELDRHLGFCRARFIGSRISNVDWMASVDADPELTAALSRALGLLARDISVDVLEINNAPASWMQQASPLLAWTHQPASDHLYFGSLAQVDGRLDAKRRRNLARGTRRLEELYGPVTLRRASSEEEVDRILAAFHDQRTKRFAQQGIPNPFAASHFQQFFRQTAMASLARELPTLRLHGLWAGEELVATAIGTYCESHYSQYINSTADGAAAKYSLMAILMLHLAEELKSEGIKTLDLGIGDFDYKLEWTDPLTVWDLFIPLRRNGHAIAFLLRTIREAKVRVKKSARWWPVAKKVRMALQPVTSGRRHV